MRTLTGYWKARRARLRARVETLEMLAKVDAGGVPFYVTPTLRRIALANGIEWRGEPAVVLIERIRERVSP